MIIIACITEDGGSRKSCERVGIKKCGVSTIITDENNMAWTIPNAGTLAHGQAIAWAYWWGRDMGLQIAGGSPKNPSASIVAYDQTKATDNNGNISYGVTLKNVGSLATVYDLQGGGVS